MSDDIIANLDDKGRIITWSVVLPRKGDKLMDEHHQRVIDAYRLFTEENGITQSQAARKIGCASSTLSQFLSGNYKGDVDGLCRKINQWIERDARSRSARVELAFVPTEVALYMKRTIQQAVDYGKMAAIVAPAGCGKTMLLKILARDLNGAYIYCDQDITPSALMYKVAAAVRAESSHVQIGGLAGMREAVINKLKGTDRPLFFDEAHLLKPSVFAGLRSLHDQAEVPLIFAGAHEILSRVDDRSTGRGQMQRRTFTCNVLEHFANLENDGGPGGKLGAPLYTEQDIERVFSYAPLKLTKGGIALLWGIACLPNHGCLGTCKDIVDVACRVFADRKSSLTADDLGTVIDRLFGHAADRILTQATEYRRRLKTA